MTREEKREKENKIHELLAELIEEDECLTKEKRELQIIEESCKDGKEGLEMQQFVDRGILECLEIFNLQGHSGFSAGYANNLIYKLIKRLPLTPLKGTDDEWGEPFQCHDHLCYMNKRSGRVSKHVYSDGRIDYIDHDAILCTDNDGKTWFTCGKYKKTGITFPYMPGEPERYYLDENDNVIRTEKK